MAKTKKLKDMTLEEIQDIEKKYSPMIGLRNNLADSTKKSVGKKQKFQLIIDVNRYCFQYLPKDPVIEEFGAISQNSAIKKAKKIINQQLARPEFKNFNPELTFRLQIIKDSIWTGDVVYDKSGFVIKGRKTKKE